MEGSYFVTGASAHLGHVQGHQAPGGGQDTSGHGRVGHRRSPSGPASPAESLAFREPLAGPGGPLRGRHPDRPLAEHLGLAAPLPRHVDALRDGGAWCATRPARPRVQDFLGLQRIIWTSTSTSTQTKGFPCLKKRRAAAAPLPGQDQGQTAPEIGSAGAAACRISAAASSSTR